MASDIQLEGDKVIIQANGAVEVENGAVRSLKGGWAGFEFADRTKAGEYWVWYANDGNVRLWSNKANADMLSIDSSGNISARVAVLEGRKLAFDDGPAISCNAQSIRLMSPSASSKDPKNYALYHTDDDKLVINNHGGYKCVALEGNVGIGTKDPGFALDVANRMRVRQADQSAGIWFYQAGKDQAFVGMASDTSVGLWGNNGAQWGLVMDTATGNVGIGVPKASATAKLEVKGTVSVTGTLEVNSHDIVKEVDTLRRQLRNLDQFVTMLLESMTGLTPEVRKALQEEGKRLMSLEGASKLTRP